MEPNFFGYPVRKPHEGEAAFFKENPKTSGMATKDRAIIFNPYSSGVDFNAVGVNEASRLWMREHRLNPGFKVTKEQQKSFKGTVYEKDLLSMKHTILGRIISGDSSAGKPTSRQKKMADWVLQELVKRRR